MSAVDPVAIATAVLIVAALAALILWFVRAVHSLGGALDSLGDWEGHIDEAPGQSSGRGLVTVEAPQAALRLHSTQAGGTEQDARSL